MDQLKKIHGNNIKPNSNLSHDDAKEELRRYM